MEESKQTARGSRRGAQAKKAASPVKKASTAKASKAAAKKGKKSPAKSKTESPAKATPAKTRKGKKTAASPAKPKVLSLGNDSCLYLAAEISRLIVFCKVGSRLIGLQEMLYPVPLSVLC